MSSKCDVVSSHCCLAASFAFGLGGCLTSKPILLAASCQLPLATHQIAQVMVALDEVQRQL